jgi:hypothetical protein
MGSAEMAFRECRDGLALGQATEQMSGSERVNILLDQQEKDNAVRGFLLSFRIPCEDQC